MVTIRMFGAAYRGRFTEAAELAIEYQNRMAALSRSPQAGQNLMALAISEALAGLHEQARARVSNASDQGLLNESSLDERLVIAAITQDAEAARELLPLTLAANKKLTGTGPRGAEGERAIRALAALAEKRPKEAVELLEPVTFDASHAEQINVWSIAKMQAGDLAAAAKGLSFMNSRESRSNLSTTAPFAYATLARVQMQLGQKDEARKNFERFFEVWKEADSELPLLKLAREEFTRLR
jgi:tetratricopeptide (TPR) repeat protein